MTFKPPGNYGVRFRRVDLPGSPEVPADIDHVVDIARGTTIELGNARVTLWSTSWRPSSASGDNVIVEVDANEPPVGDGSARPYVDAPAQGGLRENRMSRRTISSSTRPSTITTRRRRSISLPSPPTTTASPSWSTTTTPPWEPAQPGLFDLEKEFVSDFAPCRTFCSCTRWRCCTARGSSRGNLDNAIVIVDASCRTRRSRASLTSWASALRHPGGERRGEQSPAPLPNEPARHKLLDMMGDLALIGFPPGADPGRTARPCVQHRVCADDPEALRPEEASSGSTSTSARRGGLRHHASSDPPPTATPSCWSTRSST